MRVCRQIYIFIKSDKDLTSANFSSDIENQAFSTLKLLIIPKLLLKYILNARVLLQNLCGFQGFKKKESLFSQNNAQTLYWLRKTSPLQDRKLNERTLD